LGVLERAFEEFTDEIEIQVHHHRGCVIAGFDGFAYMCGLCAEQREKDGIPDRGVQSLLR
jgi:hypothetical protein